METETAAPAPNLGDFKRPEQYQAERKHLFPSIGSVDWFVREHKPRLIETGALYEIAGRKWINPPAFDRVVLESGTARAIARVEHSNSLAPKQPEKR